MTTEENKLHEQYLAGVKPLQESELPGRDKQFYDMLDRQVKQGMETLSRKLGSRLKQEYRIYKTIEAKPKKDQHMYVDGLLDILDNIFDTMKRANIPYK
jgi:transcription termination factor Rho